MAYVLPTFNLTGNCWHGLNHPPAAPDLVFDCNLCFGRRIGPFDAITTAFCMQLLVPAGTDLRTPVQGIPNFDLVEVPAGTGRFYRVQWVDDLGKGFDNEHRFALLLQTNTFSPWPIPMP